ncbi:hypothetical protein SAMN05444354_109235 [Stigmatella aurantiaca]|uniref:Uncharacterized protein n=2 Tax=Stigmatella aurantiaca TaxID=41 RepID=A0A1H7TZX7_STIAU|nr:hypothetical protein SAMN05444354_109235 [Stigmatella aurantiaca]
MRGERRLLFMPVMIFALLFSIEAFAHGGPFQFTTDSIKDVSYVSLLNTKNTPITTEQPIGYSVRLWNDQLGPMFRTAKHTAPNVSFIHDVVVEVSNIYKSASVYVIPGTGGVEQHVGTAKGNTSWNITNVLADGDAYVRIANAGDRKGFPPNWQRSVTVRVLVDGEETYRNTSSCKWCHSTDVAFLLIINRATGTVIAY